MKYRRVDTGKIVDVSPGYTAAFPAGTYVLVEETKKTVAGTKKSATAKVTSSKKTKEPTPNESEQD